MLASFHFSSNRKRGRKQVRRDRAKCYSENRKLKDALVKERKAMERYKKRYLRLVKKLETGKNVTPSPRTKTKHLLRYWKNAPGLDKVKKNTTISL